MRPGSVLYLGVAVEMRTPEVDGIGEVVDALRRWQDDTVPMQLHPGDVGWHARLGAEATAAALRTWSREGRTLAVGLLDGPGVLRLTVAPEVWDDHDLARQVVADASDPQRGVLPAGEVSVEAPNTARVQAVLSDAGWPAGEAWTPLHRDLTRPVEVHGLRVEVVEPGHESTFTAVHRSAWGSPRFTDERWRAMASGPAYADARCLLAHDADGTTVAGVTIWSAGPGKPGLLEPLGVHADHRGRGYGRAVCVAAAAELRAMGASSASVCTPNDLTAAVATYESAGFRRLPERWDRTRVV